MTERVCENCGKPIVRSYALSASRLALIRFCNTACKTEFNRKNKKPRRPQEYEIRGDVTALLLCRKGVKMEGLIDTADLPKVLSVNRRWCAWKGHGKVYVACTTPDGPSARLLLHRFLTDAPPDKLVDHINHSGIDNRRDMLALLHLRDECRKPPTRDWELMSFGTNFFRCCLGDPAPEGEVRGEGVTIKDAIFEAMRKAGMMR